MQLEPTRPGRGRGLARYAVQTSTTLALPLLLTAMLSLVPPAVAAPACGEPPETVGRTIIGTPCDDVIRAPGGVEAVRGGGGDDVILAAPIASAAPLPEGDLLGIGSQFFEGGPGDDTVFGGRGNDRLNGGGGDDRLFGGPGDDTVRGGPDDDRLSGGFGFDFIDGEDGDDSLRGDATIDEMLLDSGDAGDEDTLSYATGVTPGFPDSQGPENLSAYEDEGFPGGPVGRGVYIDLDGDFASNGVAPDGGGVDSNLEGDDFEVIVGSAFSDFIVGSDASETIYGGGGADVILGAGGADSLDGGSEGDHLDGEDGADSLNGEAGDDYCAEAGSSCERYGSDTGVVSRDTSQISVGILAPGETAGPHLYLTGSEGDDDVTATYSTDGTVTFVLAAGSFDPSPAADGGCEIDGAEAVCPAATPPDSLVLAGLGGGDALKAVDFPSVTSIYVLGGAGDDDLSGSELTEDVVVDGPGGDDSAGRGGDDVMLNSTGVDTVAGEGGNDLFLSNSLCDGDTLEGGGARDNASWSKLEEPVAARLEIDGAGEPDEDGEPSCPGDLDALLGIEDLEGTDHGDFFYGGPENAQLLGRNGADTYAGEGGEDRILANDGEFDVAIDCGGNPGDIALVDLPPPASSGDPAPTGCETVVEQTEDDFRLPADPKPPSQSPGGEPADADEAEFRLQPPNPPRPDMRPPRTRITTHPRTLLWTTGGTRKVAFRFSANENRARFRCKLDRQRFRSCRSPRVYRLKPGRHAFRVFAIDRAGNRDRTPVLIRLRIRRR
jgi:Ca2+-binding RTX toxin-like protein